MPKKLIIVCDKSCEKYAIYLQQLVSALDDKDNEIVGTQDGAVVAVVWTEEQFEDNKPKLSSSQHILFMGNGKLARARRETMPEKFNRVGMHYGWLGSQACLYVDDGSLNADNFDDFKGICSDHGKKFKNELNMRFSPKKLNGEVETETELAKTTAITTVAAEAPFPFLIAAGISDAVKGAAKTVADLATNVVHFGNDALQAKEAQDQQYSLATLAFYMDDLSEFLDM